MSTVSGRSERPGLNCAQGDGTSGSPCQEGTRQLCSRRGTRPDPTQLSWEGQSLGAPPGSWLCPHALVPGVLFTGKVVLQGGEEVSDDRYTPGPPEQLLAGNTAHVGHICVVYGKAEDPGGGEGGTRVKTQGVRCAPSSVLNASGRSSPRQPTWRCSSCPLTRPFHQAHQAFT